MPVIGGAESFLTDLACGRCGQRYPAEEPRQLCPSCQGPLLARYDLAEAGRRLRREDLERRERSLWRWRELLPVRNPANEVRLGETYTPVVQLRRLGEEHGVPRLFLKDEGRLPTGTFKARGAALGVSRALELGVRVIAMPTNGNAGSAWAAYAARAGIEAWVVMPAGAPEITKVECAAYGARLSLVDGLIGDAGRIVGEAVKEHGWFDASTLKEPYRIEGKKTMGLEIAEQFGWDVPEVIVYPTGGGVGLIGMFKAFRELQELGWVGERLPRLVAVQAAGCAPIVRAWKAGRTESTAWEAPATVAFGINVAKALGDFLVLEALYATGGAAVAVEDDEILVAERELARAGMWVCPEGAATWAGVKRLRAEGWFGGEERVLLLNTGVGLKYPATVTVEAPVLAKEARL